MLSIVIPVFNGERNLVPLIERLTGTVLKEYPEHELIFVDDGSTDGTLSELRRLCFEYPQAGWVSFRNNRGQQTAVLCGLRHSRGDWVVTMDDDLQHPPEAVAAMIEKAAEGFDAVYAVGCAAGRGGRSVGGRLRDLFFVLFLRKPAGLRIGSFRLFSRRAVELICEASGSFVYVSAELFRHGLSAASIDYTDYAPQLDEAPGTGGGLSRYSTSARIRLYLKLLFRYGILRGKSSADSEPQYEIADKGGCL